MPARLKGFVCFCPDLNLYWYKVTNEDSPQEDVDYKFDDLELENAISTHIASGNEVAAKFMADSTGLGRVNPHKYVTFDTENDSLEVVEPKDFRPRGGS
jgi:hypothetical protein